jgi:hypothetical protein
MLSITGTVSAGDEENPEIEDNGRDIFGSFSFLPQFLFRHIDIESAWFYEENTETDYLYTSLKVTNLRYGFIRAIYSIHWEYNGEHYISGLHTHTNGIFEVYLAGSNNDFVEVEGTFNEDTNIITWKIPKTNIGNPKQGDVLTSTYAWTALRLVNQELNDKISDGELVKDAAPFIQSEYEYGKDYTIQY